MIDLSEKRLAAVENRIPATTWLMLSLIAVPHLLYLWLWPRQKILAGGVVIPLMVAIVMRLMADLDSPPSGFIQVDLRSMERQNQQLDKHSLSQFSSFLTAGA